MPLGSGRHPLILFTGRRRCPTDARYPVLYVITGKASLVISRLAKRVIETACMPGLLRAMFVCGAAGLIEVQAARGATQSLLQ